MGRPVLGSGPREKSKRKTKMKLSEWRLKLTDGVSVKLKQIAGLSDNAAMRMSNLQDRIEAKFKSASTSVRNLTGNIRDSVSDMVTSFTGMSGSLLTSLTNPFIIATVVATAFGLKATQMAMQFEQGMAKVNATAQVSQQELGGIRQQIIDIGRNSAVDLQRLPDSFEKINSQINNTEQSLEVLKASVKAADAGFADLDVVSGAVARTMNLVAKEGKNAQDVVDTFMMAKKLGAGEFTDFAQYMPQLIAAGNNLGVSFANTAGTFAYMTAMGQSAADSAMLMQNMFNMLGRGDVVKKLGGMGVNVFNEDGSMRQIDDIFVALGNKMNTMSDQGKSNLLESLGIKDQQAKSAFSVMIADADKLRSIMQGVGASSGEAQRTLEATNNPMRTITEIGNQFQAFMLDIGYAILPYASQALTWIRDILVATIERVKEWWSGATLVKDLLWLVGAALGLIWDAVMAIGSAFMWVVDHTVKPIYDAINWIYEKIKDILGLSGEEMNIQAKVTNDLSPATTGSFMPGEGGETTGVATTGTDKGFSEVSGGGSQVRNVIVNMTNSFNIKAATMKESMKEVEAIAIEAVVRIAQGAELTLAN